MLFTLLIIIYRMRTPSPGESVGALLREMQIQWFIHTKARESTSTGCAIEEWEIESDDGGDIQCTYKGHWDYIWFQHVRKAGGSSVCQLLIDNKFAAERHTGDAANCQLYQWHWLRHFDADLDQLKCMSFPIKIERFLNSGSHLTLLVNISGSPFLYIVRNDDHIYQTNIRTDVSLSLTISQLCQFRF